MIFILTLFILAIVALFIFRSTNQSTPGPKSEQFQKLQNSYLSVYYLATFADWLQGPYVYKLYSDYGFEEEDIAVLYIVGFASSSICGTFVGHFADRYGRKMLCASYGIIYSICCVTKISSNFYVLFVGRICGGISTSILFSTFEAWYINEHMNHFNLPPEWLNMTFSKAGFYTGLLAIIAGIVSQLVAENLNLGASSPFLLAVPFLFVCTYIIITKWSEHTTFTHSSSNLRIFSPLRLIFFKDRSLLLLGLCQSLFEAVMYTFIFSWTPIISDLDPPLGIVFSSFMLSFMIGSKIYALMVFKHYQPQNILTMTSSVSFFSLTTVGIIIMIIIKGNQAGTLEYSEQAVLTWICFLCFIVFEFCVGVYIPVIGYLKGRVVPEEYRASVSNWFRVPMNIFTCFSLTLNQYSGSEMVTESPTISSLKKFELIYILCSVFLLITAVSSHVFSKTYTNRMSKEESHFVKVVNAHDSEESEPVPEKAVHA